MQSVINSVKGTALGVAGYLTPVLKVHSENSYYCKVIEIIPLTIYLHRRDKPLFLFIT